MMEPDTSAASASYHRVTTTASSAATERTDSARGERPWPKPLAAAFEITAAADRSTSAADDKTTLISTHRAVSERRHHPCTRLLLLWKLCVFVCLAGGGWWAVWLALPYLIEGFCYLSVGPAGASAPESSIGVCNAVTFYASPWQVPVAAVMDMSHLEGLKEMEFGGFLSTEALPKGCSAAQAMAAVQKNFSSTFKYTRIVVAPSPYESKSYPIPIDASYDAVCKWVRNRLERWKGKKAAFTALTSAWQGGLKVVGQVSMIPPASIKWNLTPDRFDDFSKVTACTLQYIQKSLGRAPEYLELINEPDFGEQHGSYVGPKIRDTSYPDLLKTLRSSLDTLNITTGLLGPSCVGLCTCLRYLYWTVQDAEALAALDHWSFHFWEDSFCPQFGPWYQAAVASFLPKAIEYLIHTKWGDSEVKQPMGIVATEWGVKTNIIAGKKYPEVPDSCYKGKYSLEYASKDVSTLHAEYGVRLMTYLVSMLSYGVTPVGYWTLNSFGRQCYGLVNKQCESTMAQDALHSMIGHLPPIKTHILPLPHGVDADRGLYGVAFISPSIPRTLTLSLTYAKTHAKDPIQASLAIIPAGGWVLKETFTAKIDQVRSFPAGRCDVRLGERWVSFPRPWWVLGRNAVEATTGRHMNEEELVGAKGSGGGPGAGGEGEKRSQELWHLWDRCPVNATCEMFKDVRPFPAFSPVGDLLKATSPPPSYALPLHVTLRPQSACSVVLSVTK
ncbi:unnamed protein product [Vitrella brassicaformis CCMP3155]|uniref:Uncharacterized protein n=1 Tax=Vitrella brassicaformis (strain CCMP3155) TaxID=1169540 RepID=A0A0G4G0V6_VITBC|nr:unnamed protein product [Vitrella brassicaformis CCMP3155]|eukprot:CEM21262.1 unnamed protein product [Vitrella brassicaformis CCMP3155]